VARQITAIVVVEAPSAMAVIQLHPEPLAPMVQLLTVPAQALEQRLAEVPVVVLTPS